MRCGLNFRVKMCNLALGLGTRELAQPTPLFPAEILRA